MFAQMEPISGGAGWLGAGLLGLVLSWLLLIHLPAKDKLFMQVVQSFREELALQRAEAKEERMLWQRSIDSLSHVMEALTKAVDALKARVGHE